MTQQTTKQHTKYEIYILNEKNIYITKKYITTMLRTYGVKHTVKDISLYQRAMTHVSYLKRDEIVVKNKKANKLNNKNNKTLDPIKDPTKAIQLRTKSYERLEFLGDSVIHCILAKYLFTRYEVEDEGFMTRLRTKIENSTTLAHFATVVGLDKYILLSRFMEKNNARLNNVHVLEDSFEAFIGALFLDGGFNPCRDFFTRLIEREVDFANLLYVEDNFKDLLLQFFHQKKWRDPEYGLVNRNGPEHKKEFKMFIKCKKTKDDNGEIVGIGIGASKKKGEQLAAEQALLKFGVLSHDEEDSDEEYEVLDSDDDDSDSDYEIIDEEKADNKNYKLNGK